MAEERPEGMSPGQRREMMLFTSALMGKTADVMEALTQGEDEKAEAALAVVDSTTLYIRNAIGQWKDRVICPACRKTGRNLVHVQQRHLEGHSEIGVGFKCEHCQHVWGTGP